MSYSSAPASYAQRPLSRRLKRSRQLDKEATSDAQFVANWVASRELAPSVGASAADRLEAIRMRVIAKRRCT